MTNLTITTKNFTIRDWFSSDLSDLQEWKGEQAASCLEEYMADEHILAVQSNLDLKVVGLFRLSSLDKEAEGLDPNLSGKEIGYEFISQDIVESYLPELLKSVVDYYLAHDGYDFLICKPDTTSYAIKDAMNEVGFSLINSAENMYLLRNEVEVANENILTEFIVETHSNARLTILGIFLLTIVIAALPLYLMTVIYPPESAIALAVGILIIDIAVCNSEFVELHISNRQITKVNVITRRKKTYPLSDLATCRVFYNATQRKSFEVFNYVKIRFSGSIFSYKLRDNKYTNWQNLVDYLNYEHVLESYDARNTLLK
ncbi:MAG: hypothetical protein MJ093_06060 [Saccharofermentans sp.]|nr:hypothetical protein [Saccharofermentans sp.]